MNNERFNPNLCEHVRFNKPPQLFHDGKEENFISMSHRDMYSLNNPSARWHDKKGRTYFAELNNYLKRK